MGSIELQKYFLDYILPELLIYVIKFFTLGIFWIGSHFHHNVFPKTDFICSCLNVLFLMMICRIPFEVVFSGIIDTTVSLFFFSVAI